MKNILDAIVAAGGIPLYVGGCVRDKLLGIEPKDHDIEVYGIGFDLLASCLKPFGIVNKVGRSFGVVKLRTFDGQELDFSLPRRENKRGFGHRGFHIEVDPNITVKEAAARRDFTINSMAMGAHGELHDYFGGMQDMQHKILRPTSEAFKEDALRVLRGMQFAGRFGMVASEECKLMAVDMYNEYADLAKERVWGEWEKWAVKGQHPAAGLQFLLDTGWVHLYPELVDMIGVEQEPEWHPEGDVWIHTLYVCEAMAKICDRENISGEQRAVMMFAALCHDMGKPSTTEYIEGRIRSRGHAEAGVEIAERFLQSIGCLQRIIDKVKPLVAEHLAHVNGPHNKRMVRRLAIRLHPATIDELSLLIEADMSGRPPLPGGLPNDAKQMLEVAKEIKVEFDKPVPIVMGRHLIERGWKPGKEMGNILKRAYEAQLDGSFENLEEALEWIKWIEEQFGLPT